MPCNLFPHDWPAGYRATIELCIINGAPGLLIHILVLRIMQQELTEAFFNYFTEQLLQLV